MGENDGFKTFTCSYNYQGSSWVFHIMAMDIDDARARVAALHFARLDGELMATIPADISGSGFLARLICFTRNAWSRATSPGH